MKDKHKMYKDHFLLITRLFDNRVKTFISKILMANEDVENYSYRIEFQVRGLPHLHGVFWLKDSALEEYRNKETGEFIDAKLPELIKKYISCSTNTGDETLDDTVKEVNVHRHSKSCQKKEGFCRFNFPRLPSDRCLIAKPLSEENLGKEEYQKQLQNARAILEKVKTRLEEMTKDQLEQKDLESILKHEKVNVTSEAYHEALSISERGQMVILERKPSEIWVNNYNPTMMLAWQANMDIQFCMDSYAIITYITDYLTKGDAGLTKELRKALKETKNCNNFEQLNYLKLTYFKNKQVSVAEATYRLIRGLDLKKSSIACIYLATGYPKNRSSFFRPAKSAEKPVDTENVSEENPIAEEEDSNELIALEGRQGQFKEVETVHQKYSQRPGILEEVCLAQFTISYHHVKADQIPKATEWIENASEQRGKVPFILWIPLLNFSCKLNFSSLFEKYLKLFYS